MVVYVIEHLDEELYPWSKCEYLSVLQYVAPSQVVLSNASFKVPQEWASFNNLTIHGESVTKIGIPFESICLLDSESTITLSPEDADRYSHFLFGGILGNTDEFDFDRTRILREFGFPTRNLGQVQMTTDTAVKTTQNIIEQGKPFDDLAFVDRPTIHSGPHESLLLNFRFLAGPSGEPLMAAGIRELMLEDNDDAFDINRLE